MRRVNDYYKITYVGPYDTDIQGNLPTWRIPIKGDEKVLRQWIFAFDRLSAESEDRAFSRALHAFAELVEQPGVVRISAWLLAKRDVEQIGKVRT